MAKSEDKKAIPAADDKVGLFSPLPDPTAPVVASSDVPVDPSVPVADPAHPISAVEAAAPAGSHHPRKPKDWEPPYVHIDTHGVKFTDVTKAGTDVTVSFANDSDAQHFYDRMHGHIHAPDPAAAAMPISMPADTATE